MTQYSVPTKERVLVKVYESLYFAKNMGENNGKK